jgi:prepilin-type processing-associated H-X9-DG protein
MSQVTDGNAYTIMLSEVRTRDDPADQRGAWALPWSGASLLAFDMHPASPSTVGNCANWRCHLYQFGSPTPPSRSGIGSYHPWWGSIGFTQPPNGPEPDVLYECPNPEAAQFEQMSCVRHSEARYMSAAARSQHLGGVNVAYLDGHVTFVGNRVDETAMAIMISANDHLEPGETF